ncbi:polysaccharide biosynthesis protein [Secundilactobacillus similis DSM 23365 = JCM 2765]|uniref:Polysaccharide biosynthesis protein n=2 Tax=Secundilactobacillus similis TaxID=414682 RepID=A0A0R2EGH2_9LACO|nr:polysaccharide biosynthesis protein [Secundilactobacillus similis]KRN15153.1 polysaccharide biosynthesis protein [Secundilactobacillus similis DSM 23365 = JCM 2765]
MTEMSKKDDTLTPTTDAQDQMVRGSAWMTAGSIFSRILGAIYIIPWGIWFGSYFFQGNALYGKGYNIYSFFLIAAIAGIPSAIAKQVAHYNAMNEYGVGFRLYKHGFVLAAITGIVCAALLYFGAPLFDGGDARVVPVLHSLAWAVLIIPVMSLSRGFFQGYQQMAPSAISQFVEQLARVLYMLGSAFIIMRVLHGSWITAVSQSTFAACVGAIAGILTLVWYYLKNRPTFQNLVANSENQIVVPAKQLYHEILQQALPFIVLGAGITIFQLIDQFTFFKIMRTTGVTNETVLNDLFAMFSVNANKLIMITVSLSSALAITAVPLLSEAFTRGDKRDLSKQITNAVLLFEFVMIPSALGMAAIAHPLNIVFYGVSHKALATAVLAFSSFVSIMLGLFSVTSAIMQGVSQNKRAVRYFAVGTIVKLALQWPCVHYMGVFGPLVATMIGFVVANVLIVSWLNQAFGVDYQGIAKKTNGILGFSLIMCLLANMIVRLVSSGLGHIMTVDSRVGSLIIVILAVGIAGYVYVYFVLKTRLADTVLGERTARLRRLLRIK